MRRVPFLPCTISQPLKLPARNKNRNLSDCIFLYSFDFVFLSTFSLNLLFDQEVALTLLSSLRSY